MSDLSQSVFCLARVSSGGVRLLGTAFALGGDKVATAAHVCEGDDNNLVLITPRLKSLNDYQDTSDNQVQYVSAAIHAIDPIRDVCVLRLSDASIDVGYALGSTDDLFAGSPVSVFGFPHVDQGRLVLTRHTAFIGARVSVSSASGIAARQVVVNMQARPGQSGAPVFMQDQPRVSALIVGAFAPTGGGGISLGGIDPQTLHQTTHAVSAEYLRDML